MACKDCIHFEMCDRTDMKNCPHFKDRSQFVEVTDCICRMKPVYDETYGSYDLYRSSKEIVGGYPNIFAGADENEELIIFAEGDETSSYYHPKFCPECGRKLRQGG